MFKIHNSRVPSYYDIIPNKHENVYSYNTRNKHNYFIPSCRLESFKKYMYVCKDHIELIHLCRGFV